MPISLWLLPLLVGWYQYFNLAGGGVWLALLIVATIVCGLLIRVSWKKVFAAHNVVAAADIFQKMSNDERRQVHVHAIAIIRRSGWRSSDDPDLSRPVERFGWYALSMAELGIPPQCFDSWSRVRNPFLAISVTDKELSAALYLAEKKGSKIDLNSLAEEAAGLDNGREFDFYN